MKDFRTLAVWEKAHALALKVYESTKSFPGEEVYGLTSQIRRACVSIPTNIAEGCGRGSDRDLARFLVIAMGSASELEYLLLLSAELDILKKYAFDALSKDVVEVKRMLVSLIKKLKTNS